jgi:hypothetical protein
VAGCSLVVGTDGLSGETATAGGDGGGVDASHDGAQPGDGGATTTDATARGCTVYPDATFCEDFDDPLTALSTTKWTSTDVGQPQGTIALVQAGAVSAPNAARLALVDAGAGCGFLKLARKFVGTYSSLLAHFSVRPETDGNFVAMVGAPANLPVATYRVILGIYRPSGSSGSLLAYVQKYVAGASSDFTSGEIPFDTDPLGRTIDMSIEMTASPNPRMVVTQGGKRLELAVPPTLPLSDPHVDFGPYCRGAASAFAFDDVAIWATP